MHRAALRIRHDGPHRREHKRRLGDRHHAGRWTAPIAVTAGCTGLVPTCQRRLQRGLAGTGCAGEFRKAIDALENAQRDFLRVVRAPVVSNTTRVGGRAAEWVHRRAIGVGDQPGRQGGVVLRGGVVTRERPRTGVLHVGVVFVHETPAAPVQQDPWHAHITAQRRTGLPVGQAFGANAKWIRRVGVAKSVRAVVEPHVPQIGTQGLGHTDTVSGVAAKRRRRHGAFGPESALHRGVALEASAGQHYAAPRADVFQHASRAHRQPLQHAAVVAQQPLDRATGVHLDPAFREVTHQHLEQQGPARRAAHMAVRAHGVEAIHGLDIGKAECVVSLKRVIRRRRSQRGGSACTARQRLYPFRQGRHAACQGAQQSIRRGSLIGALQIRKSGCRVLRSTHTTERTNRDATRVGHLLQQQHLGALVMRADRGNRAGITAAHDHHIGALVPARHLNASGKHWRRPPTSSAAISARMARPFSALASVGSPRTPEAE